MSSFIWFPKPKDLTETGEKLWSTTIKPSAHQNYCVYLDSAKELDEFYCWYHISYESTYKKFVRERERFRLYHSLTTEDELDVEKLIEVVLNLQLKVQEQEEEIESLKAEIRIRFE